MQKMTDVIGNTAMFAIGSGLILIVNLLVIIGESAFTNAESVVYFLAVGIGLGQSITMVTSLVS